MYVRAQPALNRIEPDTMEAFCPIALIRNPESGITTPWVIPQVDWTTTKSVSVMSGELCCLMYEVM